MKQAHINLTYASVIEIARISRRTPPGRAPAFFFVWGRMYYIFFLCQQFPSPTGVCARRLYKENNNKLRPITVCTYTHIKVAYIVARCVYTLLLDSMNMHEKKDTRKNDQPGARIDTL